MIIAHRGASADHRENTVEAFLGARAQGADWVELDVRPSSDGQLVVHHDPWYDRDLSVSALKGDDRPSHVPLLGEALDACEGMGVNVEIKNSPGDLGGSDVTHGLVVADLVVEFLSARRSDQDILITSFHEATLARVRELAPDLVTGQLIFDLHADPAIIERSAAAGDRAVNPWDPCVDAELMARCAVLGLEVNSWTVDDPDRIRELATLGVAGIITNTPAAALAALERRAEPTDPAA